MQQMNEPNETMRGRTEGHGGQKEILAKNGVADLVLGGSLILDDSKISKAPLIQTETQI